MRNSTAFVFLAGVLWSLTACVSSTPSGEKPATDPNIIAVVEPTESDTKPVPVKLISGPLDGNWRQLGIECRGGELNARYKKTNEAYKAGLVEGTLRIESNQAYFDVKHFKSAGNKKDYCRWITSENWVVEEGNLLRVSELKINRHGYGKIQCEGFMQAPGERLYRYELKGKILNLVANDSARPESEKGAGECASGTAVLQFERLR